MKKVKNISINQKGFTVIELLLYMGIFSILLLIMMQIFTSILYAHAESQATSSVEQDGSYIISRLTHDLHAALTVASPSLGTSANTLHITGSSLDETFRIVTSGSSQNLMVKNNSNPLLTEEPLNSRNTSINVSFTPIGNAAAGSKVTVQVVLTVTSTVPQTGGIAQTKIFQTTVQTR